MMAEPSTQPGTQPLTQPDSEYGGYEETVDDSSPAWGLLFWYQDWNKDVERLRFGNDSYSVGRACSNQIVLTQDKGLDKQKIRVENLSRVQFVIRRTVDSKLGYQIILEDHSTNCTYVNGQRVGKGRFKLLNHKDEIALTCIKKKCFVFLDTQYLHPEFPADINKYYVIVKRLGHGAFGEVHLAINKETGTKHAIKTVKAQNKGSEARFDALEQLRNEADVLCNLEHPCIVTVEDIICRSRSIYLILELMSGGDLDSRLKKKTQLREPTAKYYFVQVLLAIEHCHQQGIVHRDLKPDNILLSSPDDEAIVKITDFGLSKLIDENTLLKTYCGTPLYLAPEVLAAKQDYNPYTAAVDVWSLGVILFRLLSGYHPFQCNIVPRKPLDKLIARGEYFLNADRWSKVSAEGFSLVKQMLQVDPQKRPTIQEIFNHPWMADNSVKAKVRAVVFNNNTSHAYLLNRRSSRDFTDINDEPLIKRLRVGS